MTAFVQALSKIHQVRSLQYTLFLSSLGIFPKRRANFKRCFLSGTILDRWPSELQSLPLSSLSELCWSTLIAKLKVRLITVQPLLQLFGFPHTVL